MSVRSQRLRAKTPTSYVKYNLDFNESTDEEESKDTFQAETAKPVFSLKIKRKLRHTLDLVDLSPNKDEEPEVESSKKCVSKTPTSVKKTRKKASQFMPKVDKIEFDDAVEPVRKLVRAKRRLERQDQIEEECDKYFNFKVEEEQICASHLEKMASSDDHVLEEMRSRRSTKNVQYEAPAGCAQSALRKSSCASEQLNSTSKTPKSTMKNGRPTRKSERNSQSVVKLASSLNHLVFAEKEKSPKTPQSVTETEQVSENVECETETLETDTLASTTLPTSVKKVRQSRAGSASQKFDTPQLVNYRSSISEDLDDNVEEQPEELIQTSTKKIDRFSIATESKPVESAILESTEKKRQSRISKIGGMSQKCEKTPKQEIRRASVDKDSENRNETTKDTPQSTNKIKTRQHGSVENETAKVTPKSVEKKRQTGIAEYRKSSFKDSLNLDNNTPQYKKLTKQSPKSCKKSNHQTNISGTGTVQNETRTSFDMFDNSMQVDSTFNAEETFAVSRENSLKTYERKSKDQQKKNSLKNNTFDKEVSLVSTSEVDTTFNVGKEDASSITNFGLKVDSGKKISLDKSSMSSKSNQDSMQLNMSSSRKSSTFNVGKEDASPITMFGLKVDSGKKISLDKSSMSSKSNRNSMQLNMSSSRKSSTSFSKTPRNKLSEASLKRTTPSSIGKPIRESGISRKRWSLRSNSFSMHLADNDSINLVSSGDLKRKMSLNTPDSAASKRHGSLLWKNLGKTSLQNTPLKDKATNKSFALIRNSGSSTPITPLNQHQRRSSIFEELSISEEPTDSLDTTTPPNDLSYEPEVEDTITEDSTIKPQKRRTFELDSSINDISVLKLVSKRDSRRMSGVRKSSISTPSSAGRKAQKFSDSTIVLDDSSFDSSNSVIFVGEYFENKKSISLNDLNRRDADESFDVPVDHHQKRKSRSLSNICEKTKKSSMFFMPGQHVSTPMPNAKPRRDSLLKQVLSASAAKVSEKKPAARARNMPNFALIHQRAFDKMEDIAEHKQRKDERAKNLLSGKKPCNDEGTPQRSSSTKKKLRFAEDTAEKEKPANFIPLPNTPRPQKTRRSSSITSSSKESTPNSVKSKIAIPKVAKNPMPVFKANKENDSGLKNIWKPTTYTKFGFASKIVNKPIREREEVKAVIEKTRAAPINNTNKRRNMIKGVRSNRRFDLLMQMRNKRE